ncbi:DUF6228 family protein [Sanguibacter sp. 25GB23B1]|uniref:DUF6228 family protein n=1 Tax=unclassified Sanguibacter TaxID=2645534 RepID=UPI0032AEC2F3
MVTIGSRHEHLGLALSGDRYGGLVATLVGHDIKAFHSVEAHYADHGYGDLVEFFDDLERSWRGWDGHRSWSSLAGELAITAHHTGSHVVLRVELQHMTSYGGGGEWTALLDLALDAGEDLSSAAAGVRSLLDQTAANRG